jgi:hypothetical protein
MLQCKGELDEVTTGIWAMERYVSMAFFPHEVLRTPPLRLRKAAGIVSIA